VSLDPLVVPVAAGTVFLVRHGETVGNAGRIVQTPASPLSARGRAQAERLAARLAGAGITRIVSSDLARAAATAEYLRVTTGAPLEHEPLLQERNFGALRGTPYAELGLDLFAPDYLPPAGESWEVFHVRVDRAWARVRAAAAVATGAVAVVTHGLVCRPLASRHLDLPPGGVLPERWENTSLTVIQGPAPWRVRLLNCVAHLDGLTVSPAGDSSV
jgi:probable phosphoglycerate mutase